jgi:hypothetical protein
MQTRQMLPTIYPLSSFILVHSRPAVLRVIFINMCGFTLPCKGFRRWFVYIRCLEYAWQDFLEYILCSGNFVFASSSLNCMIKRIDTAGDCDFGY